jgi:hypothetical protein
MGESFLAAAGGVTAAVKGQAQFGLDFNGVLLEPTTRCPQSKHSVFSSLHATTLILPEVLELR